jgi:hypothetical protein
MLLEQKRGDQEPGKNEEQVDAQPAACRVPRSVIEDDSRDRDRAQAVDAGT